MADVDGANPTARIDSCAALAELVRDCGEQRLPIVDYGVAHQGLGNPPPARHVQLVQAGGVIEHYERDLTVRVAAGAPLAELQEALVATQQFLPLDADDDLSVGEALMHNVYGPLRLTYGSLRDLLLGLRYIDGAGQDIHVGGRTVKNVAGYDLTRFMVGSLGQFGLVYEANLRTYALPEQALIVEIEVDEPGRVDQIVTDWVLSDAAPAWLKLSNANGSWRLGVGYYGGSTATTVQFEALQTFMAETTGMRVQGSTTCPALADLSARQSGRAWRRQAGALVKVMVPPAATGVTCQKLAIWADEHEPLRIDALPAHGCIFVGGELTAAGALGLDQAVLAVLTEAGGVRAWHNRPAGAESIVHFGPPQDDWAIIGRLKRTMDPQDLFNPGRFVPVESSNS